MVRPNSIVVTGTTVMSHLEKISVAVTSMSTSHAGDSDHLKDREGEVVCQDDGFTFIRKRKGAEVDQLEEGEDADLSVNSRPKIYRKLVPPSYPAPKPNKDKAILQSIDEDLPVHEQVLQLFVQVLESESAAVSRTFRDRFQFISDSITSVSQALVKKLPESSVMKHYKKHVESAKQKAEEKHLAKKEAIQRQHRILDEIIARQKKELKLWEPLESSTEKLPQETKENDVWSSIIVEKQEFPDIDQTLDNISDHVDKYSSTGIKLYGQYGSRLEEQVNRVVSLRKQTSELTVRKNVL